MCELLDITIITHLYNNLLSDSFAYLVLINQRSQVDWSVIYVVQ